MSTVKITPVALSLSSTIKHLTFSHPQFQHCRSTFSSSLSFNHFRHGGNPRPRTSFVVSMSSSANPLQVCVKESVTHPNKLGDCPFCQRVLLTLEEKHLPYDMKLVDLTKKPEWFLEINAEGKVPVINLDEKWVADSDVIAKSLEEKYPNPSLATPSEKATVPASRGEEDYTLTSYASLPNPLLLMWDDTHKVLKQKFFSKTLFGDVAGDRARRSHETFQKSYGKGLCIDASDVGILLVDNPGGDCGSKIFSAFIGFLKSKDPSDGKEQELLNELSSFNDYLKENGLFINGEQISAADLSLGPKLYHMEIALGHYKNWSVPDSLPRVKSYMKNIFSRESFVKTMASPEDVIAGWAKHIS